MIKQHLKNKYNESHIRFCRYCKSRDITPVTIIKRHGQKTQTIFSCPICGEYLDEVWTKKKEH